MMILAFDPGKSGGVAHLVDGKVASLNPMPVIKATKGRTEYDIPAILNHLLLFRIKGTTTGEAYGTVQLEADRLHVIIEKPIPMPGQGPSAPYSLGWFLGLIEGICAARGIPYTLVSPQRWQKEVLKDLPRGDRTKQSAIIFCKRAFPGVNLKATERSKKDHDGMADALCLAWWGMRNI